MSEFRFVDLFCGCGGLSLGLEQAGFNVAFASDIDEVCLNTYKINRGLDDSQIYLGDISKLNSEIDKYIHKFTDIDLVCGGPPCQGFSMANRQRLLNDPRNVLYKQFLTFLSYVKPKFFLMENVKGMKNKIEEVFNDIHCYLGKQYDVCFDIFNAKNFGVPQSRERFIIVGNRIGIKSAKIIKDIHLNHYHRTFTLHDAIGDLPELKPNRIKNNTSIENYDVGFFSVDYNYAITDYYKFINDDKHINKLYNHKNRYNNDRDIEIYGRLPQGANSLHESISDIMPYKTRMNIFKDKYYKLRYDSLCKTITSHMKFDCNMYIHPTQARGLSPREAARIQSFPDDFVFYGPQNSWYKQIGNAVPVKLAYAIGKEIANYL